ncbi:MAG: extracellular solute-binding protein [Anaerolineae bacterium]
MSKFKYLGIFFLAFVVFTTACADTSNLEQALQVAQKEANALATRNSEQKDESVKEIAALATASAQEANTASTRAAGALAEAQGAAEEAVSAAEATSESIAAAATLAALPDINYDTNIYGVIDELDLNGVVVKWWHNSSGPQEDLIQDMISEFNESNQFGILIEATDEGDLDSIFEKMTTGLSTGDLPSVVVATPAQMAKYQSLNGLVALDPYFEHPVYGLSAIEESDIFPAFLQANRLPQHENQLLGFPMDKEMEILYYNADLLAALGFDEPPRNLAEFGEMACAAAESGDDVTGFIFQTSGTAVASYAFASGNDIYDYEENEFIYNSPGLVEYLLTMRELVENECATVTDERFADQSVFGEGASLFIQGSSLNLPFITLGVDANDEPFNWSVAPVPFSGYEPAQLVSGSSLAIPQTTPEEQLAAWIFIRYFSSPEQQAQWVRESDGFPVQGSTAFLLESYFEENPGYKTAFELLKYGKHEASVSGYDSIRDEVAKAYQEILEGADLELTLGSLDGLANTITAQ